jgi:hypothetical protein
MSVQQTTASATTLFTIGPKGVHCVRRGKDIRSRRVKQSNPKMVEYATKIRKIQGDLESAWPRSEPRIT